MKTNIFDIQGNVKGEMELPKVFSTSYRPDLIKRAVLAIQSHNRQPYGVDPLAGKRTSAHYHAVRHYRYGMMNKEMARMQRIHSSNPPALNLTARFVPQARKGREAHPPKIQKDFWQKINYKERILAIKSAIASTALKDIVTKRGHMFNSNLPIVVDDSFEGIKKTKQVKQFLEKIGLEAELERASKKKIRAGRGKMRGRPYKRKKGPLIVVAEDKGVIDAAKNIEGVDCCLAKNLNAELLAPGTSPGRLTIFTESAIKNLGEIYG